MGDDRMFAELMETQNEPASPPPPVVRTVPKPTEHVAPANGDLPTDLEKLGDVGYTSHSYRLTASELLWFRRFSLKLSERLDRTISHNTVIRALFRIADDEWRANPEDNKLLKHLSELKD
jgi:hypothetical protein